MSARGLEIEYTAYTENMVLNPATAFPVQPWAAGVRAAEAGAGTGPVSVPQPQATLDAAARKSRDRGASAVEWVVITAIVVAIVTGVGVLIANAVKDKARSACNQIASTDTSNATAGTAGANGDNCK